MVNAEDALKKQGILVSIAVARMLEELDRLITRVDRLQEQYHRGSTAMAGKDTDLEIEMPGETSIIGT